MLKLTIIICMVLLLCIPTLGGARTYIVGNDAVATHKSIGEAVAAASSGDTIYMKSGMYKEEVTVSKKIAIKPLIGEKGIILLDGSGKETGIKITADGCSIEGLTLRNFTQAGIMIESNENTIKGNQFMNNHPSIIIKGGGKNIIESNFMKDNFAGVVVWSDFGQNKIINNNIQGGSMSILLRDSSNNILTDNTLSESGIGIYLMNATNIKTSRNNVKNGIYGSIIYNSNDSSLTDNIYSGNKRGVYFTNTTRTELSNESIRDAIFGITMENSSDNIVRKCIISNTTEALGLRSSFKNSIADNSILGTTYAGLDLEYSNGNSITGNRISKGDGGIIMVESSANRLESNKLYEISQALLVEGSVRQSFDNAIDESNTADDKPITYIYGQSNKRIEGRDLAHLTLAYCSNFTVEKNTIDHDALFLFGSKSNRILDNNVSNAYGILLLDSSLNDISKNLLKGNKFSGIYLISSNSNNLSENMASQNNQNGISLRNSNANNIYSNNVDKNNNSGIWLNESNGNQILENTISSNPTGVLLVNSTNNQVYHNNFQNNAEQAEDRNGMNSWDKGSTTGGNYWSDHMAIGNPSKGWSRVIKGAKMDDYPFQNENGWVKPGSAVPTVPIKENLSQSMINQSIGHQPAGNGTILEATKIAPALSQKNNQSSSANKSISTIQATPSNQTEKSGSIYGQ
jgi:parallel beta-helix repeat protein